MIRCRNGWGEVRWEIRDEQHLLSRAELLQLVETVDQHHPQWANNTTQISVHDICGDRRILICKLTWSHSHWADSIEQAQQHIRELWRDKPWSYEAGGYNTPRKRQ